MKNGVRSAADARALLAGAANPPSVDLFPRSDGPGSSQDLPQFAAMGGVCPSAFDFEDPTWSWSRSCLRTPGACIDGEPIRYRAVAADDPEAFEYWAPDFHEAPLSVREVPGEPRYFVNNILRQFGLRGVRIEAEPMPAVYRGTGLGGSNLAHAGAMILASALAGLDLSLGRIYVAATQLENYFGVQPNEDGALDYGVSLTGGQEALTAFQGGFFDNVHVMHHFGPCAVASREIVPAHAYAELEAHLALINIGQRRGRGVTSSKANHAWMSAWREPEGAARHRRKPELAYLAVEALRERDWDAYGTAVAAYRMLRAELSASYLAGQDELARLCREHEAEYFPLGGGTGTCLVTCADGDALAAIVDRVEKTRDPATGRSVLPFRVRFEGVAFHGFEALGLEAPSGPREI